MLRAGVLDDLKPLAHLHVAAVTEGYRSIFPKNSPPPTADSLRPGWQSLLISPDVDVRLAEEGRLIVGSVAVAPDDSVASGLLLKRLHVLPRYWNQGIGAELHDQALNIARGRGASDLNLWVLEKNGRARDMYERRGWKLCEPKRTFPNEVPMIVDVLYQRQI